ELPVRVHDRHHPDRGREQRRGHRGAEHGGGPVAFGGVAQHPRHQRVPLERGPVRAHRGAPARATRDVLERPVVEHGARRLLQPGRVGGQRGALVGEPLQVDLGAVRGEGNTHSGEPTGSCNRTGRRRRPDGMHRITLPLLAAATLALAGCSSPATPAPGAPAPPAITARATGTVVAAPDTATVVLGVETRDRSATAALTANSERANAVIGVLQGAGVPPEDVRTSELTIHPVTGPETGRITGYEVSNLVTATLRDIAAAGA